jgi:hypothetical protein
MFSDKSGALEAGCCHVRAQWQPAGLGANLQVRRTISVCRKSARVSIVRVRTAASGILGHAAL